MIKTNIIVKQQSEINNDKKVQIINKIKNYRRLHKGQTK